MSDDTEQTSLSHLTGRIVGQSLDHFDPFQGLLDSEGKAEYLRNMRYGFRIQNYCFLIEHKTICEVVRQEQIYEVPNTAAWVLGIINLRGNLVPVFDLMKRLDEFSTRHTDARLLVFDRGELAVAIYIDGLPVGLEIDPQDNSQMTTIPQELPAVLRAHVGAAYRVGGNTWMELDHRGLFEELLSDAGILVDNADLMPAYKSQSTHE